jgi:ATP-dependent helicase/nuclease subunit A
MESAPLTANSLTTAQAAAVHARGNVLVMAGAGTGKTKTLVERCLDCLEHDQASLEELLIVTFTEAAAAEMRLRLRRALELKADASPGNDHWPQQLALFDVANIGTLHSFCLKLVREHFHEAGLDPRFILLDEGEARHLAAETMEDLFQLRYAGEDNHSVAVQDLIRLYATGKDETIRQLVLRLHHYSQTRPDAAGWLAACRQNFASPTPLEWADWLLTAIASWREQWLPRLESPEVACEKIAAVSGFLRRAPHTLSRPQAAELLANILSDTTDWPRRNSPKKSLEKFFTEAEFLSSLAALQGESDPMVEDWTWVRGHMATLLDLTREFAELFSGRKRIAGALDFHDLEQTALRLLWQPSLKRPTEIAQFWRKKLRFVFVDEYQDINAAQDKILTALAREGKAANRFLVGDVKQSIYRFRLADPKIFRNYARQWQPANGSGQIIDLTENFRSRGEILDFVNSLFQLVMRNPVGGLDYDDAAALKSGLTAGDFPSGEPRIALLLRPGGNREERSSGDGEGETEDLDESAKEARVIARQLQQLVRQQHEIRDEKTGQLRAVEFGDMAILLRSPRGKADVFTREFAREGVPLSVLRGGFYESPEILDLLSLMQLLDNPLQDAPCLAVLRSPLVGLSLNELAEIRLVLRQGLFWTALLRCQQTDSAIAPELRIKLDGFIGRFLRWRKMARQVSLSQCLEQILTETAYDHWLITQPRGEARAANVNLFLRLARRFDQFQGHGLFRFLKFVEAQREIEAEPEVPAVHPDNAVRLMSIHQSKGLEFPVVVLAALEKKFNEKDLHAEIILDDQFGLAPRVKPPASGRRYPSLPLWLAQKHQRLELRGEELRLLYVALTRARDTLILSTAVSEKKWEEHWTQAGPPQAHHLAAAGSFADWLGLWFAGNLPGLQPATKNGRTAAFSWRVVEESEWKNQGDATGTAGSQTTAAPHNQIDFQDAAAFKKLQDVLGWKYPHTAATLRSAKASVTELRRAATIEVDEEAEHFFAKPNYNSDPKKSRIRAGTEPRKLNAAEIGAAHHKFLQHVELSNTGELLAEADRLVTKKLLADDERAALDFTALTLFWESSLGRHIRAQPPDWIKRELPFTARFHLDELSALSNRPLEPMPGDEFVVVQGVADLVVLRPDEIWLVDFKTDRVRPRELADKSKQYEPQVRLYAAALNKIFGRPVTRRALHFLLAGKSVEMG